MGSSNQRAALVRARPLFVAVALAGILDFPTVAMLSGPCQLMPISTRCATTGWHASAGSQLRGWGHAGGSTSRQHTPLQDGALHGGRRQGLQLGRVQHRGARSAGLMRLRGGGLFKKMKRGQPLSVAEKVCPPAMIPFKRVPRSVEEQPSGRRKELSALQDRIGTAVGAADEPRPSLFRSRGGWIR